MSEMYPEPSPFGPDGPPQTMIDEGRRMASLDLATRLHAARIRAGVVVFVSDEDVINTAKRFADHIRGA